MGRRPAASLAPGFRFHPTGEELVRYYLRRKICRKDFRVDAIAVTDVYKSEPWELPGKSKLRSRDLEWYFFSMLDRKYSNGLKTNRATENGYWKTTGKDRPVMQKSKTVGMKKTLVYHRGRAPHGARSNWVMHEYRLIDEDLEKSGALQDAFVLCRIFQKSGTGPKNGEQYGAPFEEEDWDDDEVTIVPGEQPADEVVLSGNPYPEANDFNIDADEQKDSGNFPAAPPPFNYYESSGSYIFDEDDEKPFIGTRESYEPNLVAVEPCFDVLDFLQPFEVDERPVKEEHFVESGENPLDATYLLDEPYSTANQEPVLNEGLFSETNDILNQVEPDPSNFDMLDEYLNYFESADTNSQCTLPENDALTVTERQLVADDSPLTSKQVDNGIEHSTFKSPQLPNAKGSDVASSSHQCAEDAKFDSDYKHPFINLLGKKPTPYSFSTKDASLRLASSSQSPSSIHVTAGMVQIRNTDSFGNTLSLSFQRNGNMKVVLSLALPHRDANSSSLSTLAGMLSGKTSSAMSRACFYLIAFWVLIISISFKIASLVSTK